MVIEPEIISMVRKERMEIIKKIKEGKI